MLDVRRLRLLRELAHRGTIAAVADALAYTPSAVSQQLAALEREAGRPLLTRTGRRVRLTPAGAMLVEHAEAVLAQLERAEAALAATTTSLSGSVRLGAFPTALQPLVVPALREISRAEPDLELTVTEIDPAEVPGLLRSEVLDMALVHEYDNVPSTIGPGIELEPLVDEVVYLATAAATRVRAAIREHSESPWIVGNPGTLCHTMAMRTCHFHGFEPRVAHRVDDFPTVLRLVANAAGVALIPRLALSAVPPEVALTPLSINRRTRIAYRRGSRTQPAFSAVAAELHAAARSIHEYAATGPYPPGSPSPIA